METHLYFCITSGTGQPVQLSLSKDKRFFCSLHSMNDGLEKILLWPCWKTTSRLCHCWKKRGCRKSTHRAFCPAEKVRESVSKGVHHTICVEWSRRQEVPGSIPGAQKNWTPVPQGWGLTLRTTRWLPSWANCFLNWAISKIKFKKQNKRVGRGPWPAQKNPFQGSPFAHGNPYHHPWFQLILYGFFSY